MGTAAFVGVEGFDEANEIADRFSALRFLSTGSLLRLPATFLCPPHLAGGIRQVLALQAASLALRSILALRGIEVERVGAGKSQTPIESV